MNKEMPETMIINGTTYVQKEEKKEVCTCPPHFELPPKDRCSRCYKVIEKKELEELKLEKLIWDFVGEYCSQSIVDEDGDWLGMRRAFKQQIIALTIKKVDKCSMMNIDERKEMKNNLEGM